MTLPRATVILVFVSSLCVSAAQPPVVRQLITYPLDYHGHYLTQRDADQIVSFVQAVAGVDHHVRLISVKSPEDVEVHTGPGLRSSAGNTLHLQKHLGA